MIGPEDELELLRRHAPILRFDDRELFFPMPVEGYVASSTLWADDVELSGPNTLTPDDLDGRWPETAHLRLVSDTERRAVVKDEAKRLARRLLTSRLGRVGLFGRLLDALFLLSLFFRPTTPASTTTAAALKAERLGFHRQATCYGRVVEAGEWIVLHYAYFYAMNDWRSGYRGLNDHEADWEQAWIYLDPADRSPVWLASSSHDFRGSDLRRHWDDPEVIRDDHRPVLHPGAGSHALYYRPGDYVTRIDVPALRWLLRVQRWAQTALGIRDEATERGLGPALGAPFVDTAGGTGREVIDWDVRPMIGADGVEVPWIGTFRGLWGLDTRDPLGGERGPSGPKFTRSRQVRLSWADPVGFAGLHGTPPPSAASRRVSEAKVSRALQDLDDQIRRAARLLPLAEQSDSPDTTEAEAQRLSDLLRQRTELDDLRRRLTPGDPAAVTEAQRRPSVRSHLQHPAIPLPPPHGSGWILAGWAAASIPLIMLSIAAMITFDSAGFAVVALAVGGIAIVAEQLVRRRLQAVIRLLVIYVLVALFFGFVAGGVLFVSRYVVGALFAVGAVVLFIANLGELGAVRNARAATGVASENVAVDPAE